MLTICVLKVPDMVFLSWFSFQPKKSMTLYPQEAKTDCCSAALQHSMLEDMYGKDDGSIDWTQYGLPADK